MGLHAQFLLIQWLANESVTWFASLTIWRNSTYKKSLNPRSHLEESVISMDLPSFIVTQLQKEKNLSKMSLPVKDALEILRASLIAEISTSFEWLTIIRDEKATDIDHQRFDGILYLSIENTIVFSLIVW